MTEAPASAPETASVEPATARRLWRALEPLHAFVYFVPEGPAEYSAVGLKGARMGYFASRSAPLGPVPAEVVIATFYNFAPGVVHRAIPDAWARARPSDVLAARLRVVDTALRRLLGDDGVGSAEVTEAAELARRAAAGCSPQGRPLYAGHAALDWPDEPHLALWHAITLLREFRGDAHIAMLVAEGVGPCDALQLHSTSWEFPKDLLKATRAWSDDEWGAAGARLVDAGVLSAAGDLTEAGGALRQRIEDATDRLALAPWAELGADGCARLLELGRPPERGGGGGRRLPLPR